MEAHKLASLAGTVTMVVFGALHYAEPLVAEPLVMLQQGTSPQPGRSEQPTTRPAAPSQPVERFPRTNQPNQPTANNPSNPGTQPPATNPNTMRPGQVVPGAPGPVVPGTGIINPGTGFGTENGPFFAFQNPTMQTQFNELAGQLSRLEQQLAENNQRLLRQLGQARQLTGERKADALGEVLQGDLQQQGMLLQYLVDLRATVTGGLANQNATATDANGNPVNNPGTAPATGTPRTTAPGANNPNAPANNPQNPR